MRNSFPFLLFLLLFVLRASAPLPASGGVEEGGRLYSEGRSLLSSGNETEAERAFGRAIREDPLHAEATLQLASLYSRNITTYDNAETLYLSIPAIASKAGGKERNDLLYRAGVGLGKLYVKSGRNVQAIMILRNVIASAPPGVRLDDAHSALGLAYYYERLYDDAISEMRRAIKINPNHEGAKFNLKTIRTRLSHFQAGKAFSRLGERERAVAEFRKAIELDPRFIEARYRLGMELYSAGNPAEAIRELRRASLVSADYRKGFEIWYAEGLALARLGRADEALSRFGKTVQARPGFAPAHYEMGKILLQRDEYDAAIDRFGAAIGADPRAEYGKSLQEAMTRKARAASKEAAPAAPAIPPVPPAPIPE